MVIRDHVKKKNARGGEQSAPMAFTFCCLSKSDFSSFQFPLYMVFFRGVMFEFFIPFSVSEFAGFKNIYMYVCIYNKVCLKSLGGVFGLSGLFLHVFFMLSYSIMKLTK